MARVGNPNQALPARNSMGGSRRERQRAAGEGDRPRATRTRASRLHAGREVTFAGARWRIDAVHGSYLHLESVAGGERRTLSRLFVSNLLEEEAREGSRP